MNLLLCRERWGINWKRTYRVYREAGLAILCCRRKRVAGFERRRSVIALAGAG